MTASNRSAARIGSSIDVLRRQLGLGAPASLDVIRGRWSDMVGEALAERSRVVELRHGTVMVDAGDPGTADALGWARLRLIGELHELCPAEQITDLTVRVRRLSRG